MTLAQQLTTGRLGCDCLDHFVEQDGGGVHFTIRPKQEDSVTPVDYYRYFGDDIEAIKAWHSAQIAASPQTG